MWYFFNQSLQVQYSLQLCTGWTAWPNKEGEPSWQTGHLNFPWRAWIKYSSLSVSLTEVQVSIRTRKEIVVTDLGMVKWVYTKRILSCVTTCFLCLRNLNITLKVLSEWSPTTSNHINEHRTGGRAGKQHPAFSLKVLDYLEAPESSSRVWTPTPSIRGNQ